MTTKYLSKTFKIMFYIVLGFFILGLIFGHGTKDTLAFTLVGFGVSVGVLILRLFHIFKKKLQSRFDKK